MSEMYNQWTSDSECLEFLSDYQVDSIPEYEFINRQDDYYVTLLNKLYLILEGIEGSNGYLDNKEELLKIANGLTIYSANTTKEIFCGVDVQLNQLYVSAIYYLCDFFAVSSLLLKGANINKYETESAKFIYFILSGGNSGEYIDNSISIFNDYIKSGEREYLINLIASIKKKYIQFSFDSLDDFFDTFILIHVLQKFIDNNIWTDLLEVKEGIDWRKYVLYSYNQHILSFLPSQKEAIHRGCLNFKKSFSLSMPTSSGKSYLTELVIYAELQKNPDAKILYLAPLRSLASELKHRFEKVSKQLGFTCQTMYGGSSFSTKETACLEAQLLISTPEKFMAIEGSLDEFLFDYSLVICDEGQLLDDINRGVNYELLLSRLKKMDNKNFLFISAIIPNIVDVNTWLGGDESQIGFSEYRPALIKFGYSKVEDLSITLQLYDNDYTRSKFIIPKFISNQKSLETNISLKRQSSALALKSLCAGSVMIYTQNKNGNRGCIAFGNEILSLISNTTLASPITFSKNLGELKDFIEYIQYQLGDDCALVKFAKEGFVYHNADLPQDIREYIERMYSKNVLALVISTSTLAEGVNLPIKTLVLANIQTQEINDGYLLDRKRLKNIIGRVGRAGREKYGVVILPAGSNDKTLRRVLETLKNIRIERINGALYDSIKVLSKLHEKEENKDINAILEEENIAGAIDLMISRYADENNLVDINIEDIITDSLAYHLGDELTKQWLKQIFEVRYHLLNETINIQSYASYKLTGLSVHEYQELGCIVSFEDLDLFNLSDPICRKWLEYIISLLYKLDSYTRCKQINNTDELLDILVYWMKGCWYNEIAQKTNKNIEDILAIIYHIKGEFHMKISSIVRYIINSDINYTGMLALWPDFVLQGIDSMLKYYILQTGITDRIAVNSIYNYLHENGIYINTELDAYLTFESEKILEYINIQEIPIFTKKYIRKHFKL